MNKMMKAYTPDIFTVSPNFFHTVFSYKSLEPENVPNVPNDGLSERQNLILNLLKNDGNMTAAKIAEECDVSEKTIKRDIAELKSLKLISRKGSTHGKWVVLDKWLR